MKKKVIEHIGNLDLPPILDVKRQWCFIRNPKAATHTVLDLMEGRDLNSSKRPRSWRNAWRDMCKSDLDDVVVFTFVRNPWDRVLSAFSFCQQLKKSWNLGRNYEIDEHWTFHDWIMDVLLVEGVSVNLHFVEQIHSFMCNGAMIPNVFVGRYEQLEQDLRKLLRLLGLNSGVPRRLNTSRHDHYTTYYDSDTKAVVSNIYRKEIELLGYEYGE